MLPLARIPLEAHLRSKEKEYFNRFHTFSQQQIALEQEEVEGGSYQVDENMDGTIDYEIGNSNFNFVEFRSNMVLRWEYIPGSTLFLVWNQGRSGFLPVNRNYRVGSLSEGLLDVSLRNIFLIKYTYRFVL